MHAARAARAGMVYWMTPSHTCVTCKHTGHTTGHGVLYAHRGVALGPWPPKGLHAHESLHGSFLRARRVRIADGERGVLWSPDGGTGTWHTLLGEAEEDGGVLGLIAGTWLT